jgi:hypothetical protein
MALKFSPHTRSDEKSRAPLSSQLAQQAGVVWEAQAEAIMGYRSDVVLAIAPEAASAFMALCAKSPKVLEFCHDADQFKSGYAQEGDWFMYWTGIKWYESFPEVEALKQFIEMMDSDEPD